MKAFHINCPVHGETLAVFFNHTQECKQCQEEKNSPSKNSTSKKVSSKKVTNRKGKK